MMKIADDDEIELIENVMKIVGNDGDDDDNDEGTKESRRWGLSTTSNKISGQLANIKI